MVLTVYFVVSLVNRACCHHPQRNAKHCRSVDTSVGVSGRHDFAVRNFAVRLSATPRPPHPLAQRFVTIAKRPLLRTGMARIPKDDLPDGTREIFLETKAGRRLEGCK
jgi:hypothetical protein